MQDRMEDAWEMSGQEHQWAGEFQEQNMDHMFDTAFKEA